MAKNARRSDRGLVKSIRPMRRWYQGVVGLRSDGEVKLSHYGTGGWRIAVCGENLSGDDSCVAVSFGSFYGLVLGVRLMPICIVRAAHKPGL